MNQVDLGTLIAPAQVRRAGKAEYPVLSMTMRDGLVDQADKFKKRVASADTASYKVVARNQLVVGFPIDEGVLAFQRLYDAAIVSPAYNIWDLRDDASIHRVFLEKFLRSPRALEFYRSKLRSTTARRRSLPSDIFLSLAVPLPPLVEQERLVKLLDEADVLRKLRAQADSRAAALVPAIFHEMFGRHLMTPPVRASTVEAVSPRGWRWARLTQVARLASGHTPSRRIPAYWEGGTTPWITLTDIRKLDGTVAQTTGEFVTDAGLENSSAVRLPKGTVCFSRTASVGFVTVMGREMCTSQDFVNWVCGEELDPIYLMGALMQAREHLRLLASGSTHKTIYFPTVEQFSVILPPLSLQKDFAQRITEVRELETKQAASRQCLDALFQSMLDRAFNGEL